jgi:dipeptidyl aminopeptidase/acylaminoacyl peptidase
MYSADGQIVVAAWDDGAGTVGAGRAVTSLETEADGAIWAPDSKHFVFVSSVYPECEVAGAQRFAEEATCNAAKDAAAEKSPVKAQVWDHLLYRHWDHYVGAKHSHIFYGSVEGGVPEDLTPASVVGDHEAPTFQLDAPLGYAISPDGREIAYVVNLDKVPAESTNNDVFVLQVGAEPGTAKKVSTSLGSDDGPAYSPDGKWLAWRSQKRAGFESDKFDLVVMDRGTGAIRDLTEKFPNWVDEFTWIDDSQHLFFSSPLNGEEPLYHVNVTGDSLTALPKGGGMWSDFTSRLVSGREHIIGSRMWVQRPAEIFNVDAIELDDSVQPVVVREDPPTKGEQVVRIGVSTRPHAMSGQLTHVNDVLASQLSLSPLEPFWFAGANGTKVEGFVVKPPGFDAAKKYPVKFLMHGGPQTAWGDAWSYRWNWELMAASGYVVVGINRRGSTGYGQKFVDEVSGDWGDRAYEDLMKGLDYAEAHYPFMDKTRECALGASYGGFMADWVLTHTNRFKCIVTHDGMYDPVAAYGSTEEMWFNEWEFRRPEDFPKGWDGFSAGYDPMGHPAKTNAGVPPLRPAASGRDDDHLGGGHAAEPWRYASLSADEDPFRRWSPMRFIENAKTPTLVIHSQRDYRLDVSQGMELFTALQRLGVPSKMLYFPDEGHWILKPQNAELWNAEVGDWCDRWTKTGKYAEGQ